jgi:hypothetical protein
MKTIIEKQNELLDHYRKFADDEFNYDEVEAWYEKRTILESELSNMKAEEKGNPLNDIAVDPPYDWIKEAKDRIKAEEDEQKDCCVCNGTGVNHYDDNNTCTICDGYGKEPIKVEQPTAEEIEKKVLEMIRNHFYNVEGTPEKSAKEIAKWIKQEYAQSQKPSRERIWDDDFTEEIIDKYAMHKLATDQEVKHLTRTVKNLMKFVDQLLKPE